MTLASMADLICKDLNVYDALSLELIKAFLSKEYQTLWDKYPWSDTQMNATAIVPLGHPTAPFPTGMGRIITIRAAFASLDPDEPPLVESPDISTNPPPFRSDAHFIDPVSSTYLIETDPDIFERIGPVKYYEEGADLETGDKSIRLYPRPSNTLKLFIIGKGICPGLTNDNDVPVIRNIEPALIAYAIFDMLQRQRQYAKADLKRKEAQELEQVAWNLEQQQANLPRRNKTTTVAGNSLGEMMDAVCTICGQWTPDYQLFIREFLRRNYQVLYDMYLWPESLLVVRVGYSNEQVILPNYVDKVLNVRGTNDLRMFPSEAGLIMDIAPSVFEEIGDPVAYTTLTPVAVPVLPTGLTKLVLTSSSGIDKGPMFIRGEVIDTGQELEEQIYLDGTTPVTTRFAYDIPITIAKDLTIGDVSVLSATTTRQLGFLPGNRREFKHQRLWFTPHKDGTASNDVSNSFACLVLAKRAIRPLITDEDTPIITGAQQVLIAAAASDVFRKLEKHDMANEFQKKAGGSTDVLKAKNTDQAASAPRFVPQIEPRAYIAGVGGCCGW